MFDLTAAEWRDICPDLSVGQEVAADEIVFKLSELDSIADQFWKDGYLNLAPQFDAIEINTLISGLEALKNHNIPPVFIYVFDQPWALFEKLRHLVQHFLGQEYALLPNFWAWHLTETGQTGWPPHRDCDAETVFDIGSDKMLMSLSLWIPLNDVDEDNGCMYVIGRQQEEQLSKDIKLEKQALRPYATPLSANAGSVLGWPQDLVHWGGEFTEKAKSPRMSLSFEFQNSSFDPLIAPFLDTGKPPAFEERLILLKAQFEKYRHIDPVLRSAI